MVVFFSFRVYLGSSAEIRGEGKITWEIFKAKLSIEKVLQLLMLTFLT
jgi:hypothetical protein